MGNKDFKKKNTKRPPERNTGAVKTSPQSAMNKIERTPYYVLFVLVVLLYANSLVNQYALDDRLTITENKFTTQGVKGIDDILSNDSFVGFFGKQKNLVAGGRYRPLSLITFAIEYEMFGLRPFVSHLVNILLYALSCLLVFKVLMMLFKPLDKKQKWYLTIPFIATALFIAHPLHVEAVANIKGRDEIMSLLASIASFYFVLKYTEGKKILNLILSAVCFFLALLSKENAITFLAVIPLSLYFFKKSELKPAVTATGLLLFVSAIFVFIRYKVLGYVMGESIEYELLNNPFIQATASQKFATILLTWGKYLLLLVFPHPLTHDYYPKQIPIIEMGDIRAILSALIYIAMIIFAFMKIGKRNLVAYGILFFGLTFSISSNLVFPIGTFMNDRFMFIPLLGFTLIIAYYLSKLLKRKSGENIVIAVAAVILVAYSVKTISRNPIWYDDYTLFTTDVKVSSNSAKCNVSAGGQTLELAEKETDQVKKKKMISDAMVFLNKGIEIHPTYTAGWVLLGRAMLDLEDYTKARGYYKIALKINSTQSEALNNWLYCAQMSAKNKDYKEAAISYRELIKYQQKNEDLYVELATIYESDSKTDSALLVLDTLLKKNPQSEPALSKMGEIYGKILNNLDKSLEYLLRAYTISPTDASLLENLGIAYGLKKNFEKSLAFFQKAIEADPAKTSVYSNMSGTYNMMGNKEKALECLQKAAELQKKAK
jgi:protein O-mannosyl-transferase